MNSSANQIPPTVIAAKPASRMTNSCHRQVLPDALENPAPDVPPPGRNMPSTARFTQGGKLAIHGAQPQAPGAPLVDLPGNRIDWSAAAFSRSAQAAPKAAINGVWTRSRVFIEYLSLGADDLAFGIEDFSRGF
jgi:hypothetical protein